MGRKQRGEPYSARFWGDKPHFGAGFAILQPLQYTPGFAMSAALSGVGAGKVQFTRCAFSD